MKYLKFTLMFVVFFALRHDTESVHIKFHSEKAFDALLWPQVALLGLQAAPWAAYLITKTAYNSGIFIGKAIGAVGSAASAVYKTCIGNCRIKKNKFQASRASGHIEDDLGIENFAQNCEKVCENSN